MFDEYMWRKFTQSGDARDYLVYRELLAADAAAESVDAAETVINL